MRQAIVTIILILCMPTMNWAEEVTIDIGETVVRFDTADVFIDSKNEAMAAYQVEIGYNKDRVKIVGLEGGENEAFGEPPFFDPRGMKGGRIIIAAFAKNDEKAPKGETRVARFHLHIKGEQPVRLTIKLMTAAKPGGERIHAVPKLLIKGNEERQ